MFRGCVGPRGAAQLWGGSEPCVPASLEHRAKAMSPGRGWRSAPSVPILPCVPSGPRVSRTGEGEPQSLTLPCLLQVTATL